MCRLASYEYSPSHSPTLGLPLPGLLEQIDTARDYCFNPASQIDTNAYKPKKYMSQVAVELTE